MLLLSWADVLYGRDWVRTFASGEKRRGECVLLFF